MVRLSAESIDQLRLAGAGRGPDRALALRAPSTDTASVPVAGSVRPGATTIRPDRAKAAEAGPSSSEVARPPAQSAAGAAPASKSSSTCQPGGAPVAVGQVGTFSGVVGPITAGARTALAAWAKDVNARGGLDCRPVELYTVDDGGDPARASAAVRDLVAKRKVVAFVANVIAFTVNGFRPAVEAARVPAVGGELITAEWNKSPWMFPQGGGFDDQLRGFIANGVQAGHARLGVLYCVEIGACGHALKTIRDGGAEAAGAQLVFDAPISLTQTDYTSQCLNAKNAKADQLLLGMDGSSMTRVARSCAAIGYRPLLSTIAGTMSPAHSTDQNLREFGMATATGVASWTSTDQPGPRDYHQALRRWVPTAVPDGLSILAWTAGKMLEAAVAAAPRASADSPLTPATVVAGLGNLRGDTLGGLTGPLRFELGKPHAGTGCVFYQRLGPAGWTTPRGSRPVCR